MSPATVSQRLAGGIKGLLPGYFALVMATGIVSIAANAHGMASLAKALLATNVVAYATLWVLLLIRLVAYRAEVMRDLGDHQRGPGFFTVVAGTCVLGAQLLLVGRAPGPALVLWIVGIALWAYSRKRQDGFNEAAQLALVDDHPAHPLNGDRQ